MTLKEVVPDKNANSEASNAVSELLANSLQIQKMKLRQAKVNSVYIVVSVVGIPVQETVVKASESKL